MALWCTSRIWISAHHPLSLLRPIRWVPTDESRSTRHSPPPRGKGCWNRQGDHRALSTARLSPSRVEPVTKRLSAVSRTPCWYQPRFLVAWFDFIRGTSRFTCCQELTRVDADVAHVCWVQTLARGAKTYIGMHHFFFPFPFWLSTSKTDRAKVTSASAPSQRPSLFFPSHPLLAFELGPDAISLVSLTAVLIEAPQISLGRCFIGSGHGTFSTSYMQWLWIGTRRKVAACRVTHGAVSDRGRRSKQLTGLPSLTESHFDGDWANLTSSSGVLVTP